MNDLKWRNWKTWIYMNEFTRMDWHEWIDMNGLTWMDWKEWLAKSAPNPSFFLAIYICEIELSLQSRARFVDLIFKKCSVPVSFWRFLCEIELSLKSRAHFVDHFPDRCAQPRKQRPSSGDHGQPLCPKKRWVLRLTVFSAVNSRLPDHSHFTTTWWWCDWHDDVVDMMVRQLAARIVRNSEVSELNFLW